MKVIRALMLCLMLAVLEACGSSSVADGVGQREANKIVAVLGENGIRATTEKARGSKGRYTVLVASSDFGSAAAFLSKLGLPAERGASFQDLMAPSGILPSSQEVEDLRLDRAIASEVEDLLMAHAGISSASVVVRSHANRQAEAPSVSIVTQIQHGSVVSAELVREVVDRAVPGLKGEDISLVLSEQGGSLKEVKGSSADSLVPFLVLWRVPASEYNGLAFLFIGLLGFVAAMAAVGGYIYGQFVGAPGAVHPLSSESHSVSAPKTVTPFKKNDEEDDG